MKNKLLIVSLCGCLLLCTGCKKEVKLKEGKEVVASVKGKEITAEDLFSELKNKYGATVLTEIVDDYIMSKEINNDKEAKEKAEAQLKSMKEQYVSAGYDFDSALKEAGMTEEDLLNDYTKQNKKSIVVNNYLKKDVTEDEVNEYYEKEIYGKYTVKHILIKPEANDNMSDEEKDEANKKALEKAKEVIKKLDNGEKWADLVKEYSDDTGSKKDEGLIKDFTKGDVVDEFFDASVELKKGKYTKEPVESTYGYHIILKVSSTKKPSLKDSKEEILNKIVENKLSNNDKLSNETWIKIRKDYKLKIEDSKIESNYNRKNAE